MVIYDMLDIVKHQLDRWQPDVMRQEDRDALPPGAYLPVLSDMVLPGIAMSFFMVFLRKLFDRFVVRPFGEYFGVNDQTPKVHIYHHPLLEAEYKQTKSPNHNTILSLSKKTGMRERHIQIWFRKRKRLNQVSDMKRLSDAGWSFIFYAILSWYGVYVLWDKPWFTNSMECWVDWPGQMITNDVYWYYLIELGFYMSYLYMLFTDHKRKDFLEFFVHHSVTVALMLLSWSINVVRIGTLVLVIHDQVDYLLALAKSAIYIKKNLLADIVFGIFLITWTVTRLFVYPYVVLYSVYIALPAYTEDKPYLKMHDRSVIGQLLKALLVVLQILHVLWTVLIYKAAIKKVIGGKLEDSRSDTEGSNESDNDVYKTDGKEMNGNNNGVIIKEHMQSNGNGHLEGK